MSSVLIQIFSFENFREMISILTKFNNTHKHKIFIFLITLENLVIVKSLCLFSDTFLLMFWILMKKKILLMHKILESSIKFLNLFICSQYEHSKKTTMTNFNYIIIYANTIFQDQDHQNMTHINIWTRNINYNESTLILKRF